MYSVVANIEFTSVAGLYPDGAGGAAGGAAGGGAGGLTGFFLLQPGPAETSASATTTSATSPVRQEPRARGGRGLVEFWAGLPLDIDALFSEGW